MAMLTASFSGTAMEWMWFLMTHHSDTTSLEVTNFMNFVCTPIYWKVGCIHNDIVVRALVTTIIFGVGCTTKPGE